MLDSIFLVCNSADCSGDSCIPIYPVTSSCMSSLDDLLPGAKDWANGSGFQANSGEICILPRSAPGGSGAISVSGVLFGMGDVDANSGKPAFSKEFLFGALPNKLPAGNYRICDPKNIWDIKTLLLAWGMGSYNYYKYKSKGISGKAPVVLCVKDREAYSATREILKGVFLCRDVVNCPANDMGPGALEGVALEVANHYGASCDSIKGKSALLREGYPLVYEVGKSAIETPRLVDFSWGEKGPNITIIGKGVCFDSGGLCLKPSGAMRNMKKDMGGAAAALALAVMIMESKLWVKIRVIIPIVENAVSSMSFRPGDILQSRSGKTVEVHDTDAEGRLILADALTAACEAGPDMIVDFATLTGAARIALGGDIVPYYTNSSGLAKELDDASVAVSDPLWRMPLWFPYSSSLNSNIADIANSSASSYPNAPGSIVAALFLQNFLGDFEKEWVHFDCFSWNHSSSPGRPEGGECQSVRSLFHVLEKRYGRM